MTLQPAHGLPQRVPARRHRLQQDQYLRFLLHRAIPPVDGAQPRHDVPARHQTLVQERPYQLPRITERAQGRQDEQWLVGWSRLGDRLRLTSTAEFAGYDWGWTPRDFNNILRLARDLFADAADYERGQYRACLRPMTPDGPPILGFGHHRNLFLNCGHGHMGWTMACGTARIVADLMTGRMPELDLEGLTLRR